MTEKTETPAEIGRGLMRRAERATLATLIEGAPYASLVLTALTHDAEPLLLISDLAEHTKNLKRDPRVSLLFDGTAGYDEPLTGPRVTVQGEAAPVADPQLLARFTRRHPSAGFYAGFKDFHLYRVAVARGHLVAGFGRIDWIAGEALHFPAAEAQELAQAEADILEHMNKDHAEALDLYANKLLNLPGSGWAMVGIDPEGLDLRRNAALARLAFPSPIRTARESRTELARLAKTARSAA